jgi:hypothetical protein
VTTISEESKSGAFCLVSLSLSLSLSLFTYIGWWKETKSLWTEPRVFLCDFYAANVRYVTETPEYYF